MRQVILHNISPESFEVLLTYMYTGRLRLTCMNIGEVYHASRLLHMKDITSICSQSDNPILVWQILSGKIGGVISTLYLYVTAKRLNLPSAWKRALSVICWRFEEITSTVEFLDLDVELVGEILAAEPIRAQGCVAS
ncbi:IPP [Cordylochernes scorpioides]|uniref:IPP n=1 Tax=Cordylochernes scorpioides TaxID=51811 RepID=A0ABY6KFV4_9ARAC|nr:IPP [Cordylochernes scorpioides]